MNYGRRPFYRSIFVTGSHFRVINLLTSALRQSVRLKTYDATIICNGLMSVMRRIDDECGPASSIVGGIAETAAVGPRYIRMEIEAWLR